MYMTILAFGALAGPPISGAITTATGNYKATGVYAGRLIASCQARLVSDLFLSGSTVLVSVFLMWTVRSLVLKNLFWGKF